MCATFSALWLRLCFQSYAVKWVGQEGMTEDQVAIGFFKNYGPDPLRVAIGPPFRMRFVCPFKKYFDDLKTVFSNLFLCVQKHFTNILGNTIAFSIL